MILLRKDQDASQAWLLSEMKSISRFCCCSFSFAVLSSALFLVLFTSTLLLWEGYRTFRKTFRLSGPITWNKKQQVFLQKTQLSNFCCSLFLCVVVVFCVSYRKRYSCSLILWCLMTFWYWYVVEQKVLNFLLPNLYLQSMIDVLIFPQIGLQTFLI